MEEKILFQDLKKQEDWYAKFPVVRISQSMDISLEYLFPYSRIVAELIFTGEKPFHIFIFSQLICTGSV